MDTVVNIIGAGLAGSEACYQLAKRGIKVRLYEMRPKKKTEAHQTGFFAELVCSNSLRANSLENAVGVLKEEMRLLDSLIIRVADKTQIPAGGALAVDRESFPKMVTDILNEFPNVEVVSEEVEDIPSGLTIIASGPLTSPKLHHKIQEMLGSEYFYFYDAAAPIVDKESINFDKVYLKSRYDKGEAAYLNCPMTEDEFNRFYDALVSAEVVKPKSFEKEIFFEGCMPIEVMASRGRQTLLFGPMKPVGLEDPKTGQIPYAVVQLRQDNAASTMYNLVGFQTHLKFPEQKRVFGMIPGLEEAEFLRYGVMHRNSFINSPLFLKPTYQYKENEEIFFAGQMTGVEGYVESAASGMVAGINMARLLENEAFIEFPNETIIGSMSQYITNTNASNFQPMNANFGIVPPLNFKHKKKERKSLYGKRALEEIKRIKEKYQL
ncbi:methylenetetrahydrofolate--tRNA-(uracil(54)-C(5))-methyltransferase (FADH(2)-oxidizing) TrmFO [Mycoplasmatota bacterium]|nr:methylenetetrahydrofolate--tRNA-(uracil(54)-C(5))-methyltransferase (FADH(2)-oxidizing) TrmFO [Mycoplasmatota bacterium]